MPKGLSKYKRNVERKKLHHQQNNNPNNKDQSFRIELELIPREPASTSQNLLKEQQNYIQSQDKHLIRYCLR